MEAMDSRMCNDTRPAIVANSVPVEDTIGGVRALLDFKDNAASANPVHPSARHKHGRPSPHGDPVKALRHPARLKPLAKLRSSDATFQAGEQLGALLGLGHIPHLCFGSPCSEAAAEAGGWT